MKPLLLAALLPLLAAPARAADAAAPNADACSYLKDVEGKDCAALDAAALTALDAAAQARKLDVAKVYEALRDNSALDGLKDDKDAGKSSPAGTELLVAQINPPLNERTIPAWYPKDEKVIDVYRRWIAGVNADLRRVKDDKENPVSEERRKEIDAILANNKVTLQRMKGLKGADEFRCFVGDGCGKRGEADAPVAAVYTAQSSAGKDFAVGADKRPYRLASAVPGGSIDRTAPPAPAHESTVGVGVSGSGALGAAAAAGVLLLAGGAAWWKKRGEENAWKDAQKEVLAQEPKEPAPAKPAPAAAPAGPYTLNGYSPQGFELKVINDIVAGADRKSPESIAKYINAKMNVGAYGYDPDAIAAADKISTMVMNGQIVFSPR